MVVINVIFDNSNNLNRTESTFKLKGYSTVRSKKKIRVGADQKFQLEIRYDFNYLMSVLKVRLVILRMLKS
jgi:hypothetical protein